MSWDPPSRRTVAFILLGLAVSLALAFFLSRWVSDSPDGLNKVAADTGFAAAERPHVLEDGPLAGYEVEGVEDEGLSKGLSGVVGVLATFAVAGAVFAVVGRSKPRSR